MSLPSVRSVVFGAGSCRRCFRCSLSVRSLIAQKKCGSFVFNHTIDVGDQYFADVAMETVHGEI